MYSLQRDLQHHFIAYPADSLRNQPRLSLNKAINHIARKFYGNFDSIAAYFT